LACTVTAFDTSDQPAPAPENTVVGSPADLPGVNGLFVGLGSRGSLGMDVVLVGLIALLPVLAWSIAAVRRGQYLLHKRLQLVIVGLLAAAIVFFEIDIRLLSDWRERARPSVFWPAGVFWSLGIHLVFAISTLVLWVWVLWEAVSRFPNPPQPANHGPRHRFWARLAAMDLAATAITGFIFYWLAFVA
jgi:uncharacterized membrane protein YozB (DUF420 family)